MRKIGRLLMCLVLSLAMVLQFDFAADSARAGSGKARIKVNKVIKKRKKIQIEVTVSNNTKRNISIGNSVNILQKRVGGRWKKIKMRKNAASTSMANPIDHGEKRTFLFYLTGFYRRSQLRKGKYRVGIQIVDGKMMYAAFRM